MISIAMIELQMPPTGPMFMALRSSCPSKCFIAHYVDTEDIFSVSVLT